ncbi:MAG: hypothetical protein KGL39_40025 [Patescibacteria group bacterium]|nr:hypothetical protein [Patescibacteria group bacterium]
MQSELQVGTKVRNLLPVGTSITYGEGPSARTVRRGVIGVITRVNPAVPACGREFPGIPKYYTVAIDGIDVAAMDVDDDRWEVIR